MKNTCFELEHIEVRFLDREILKVDHLSIHQFDRIGIVGQNGSGKSTLLNLLAGRIEPSSGIIRRHVEAGYFEQIDPPDPIAEMDGALLSRLEVPQDISGLSGGEETRLKLANLFSEYHEALLIDEPTTHLDQDGVEFLLDELRYYYGALILISHDRNVLDQLVTAIWEVRDGTVDVYPGNYSDFAERKRQEREQQKMAHEQFEKERGRLEKAAREKMRKAEKVAGAGKMSKRESKSKPNRMFESKSKGSGQKAMHRAAKAIEQRLEQMEAVEGVKENHPIVFPQSKTISLHNKFPIMADGLMLEAGGKVLLEKAFFQFPLGEVIAVTGPNGSGKSTLLRHIAEAGDGLVISPKAKIGHFRQMSYRFSKEASVLEFLKSRSAHPESLLRSVLHSMQFIGTDLVKNVRKLSGGEAIRLHLSALFLGEYNILLLDEPTNFLDIQAIEALERFIKGYEGTIILVSHDRAFRDRVGTIHFEISDHTIIRD